METQNYVLAITGESPASVVAAAAPAQPPLTIDATTGQPVTSTVDVSTLPTIDASGNVTASAPASGIDAGTAMSLALVGLGVWLAYDLLAG
jgi:hypothetical protein